MTEPRAFNTKPPVPFTIDGEEFHVIAAVPAEELATLLDLQSGLSGEGVGLKEQYQGIKEIFQFTMIPEAWDRFNARLSDRSRPIDFPLLLEITNWLSGEVWSSRPTSPPSPSIPTPESDGTTSMAGAVAEESILTEPETVEISVVPDTSIESGTGLPVV